MQKIIELSKSLLEYSDVHAAQSRRFLKGEQMSWLAETEQSAGKPYFGWTVLSNNAVGLSSSVAICILQW